MIPGYEQTDNPAPAMAVVSRKEPVPVSRLSTQSGQLHSRPGVQVSPVISRVAPEAGSVSADNGSGMLHGPVYLTVQHPAEVVRELETRPQCNSYRCPANTYHRPSGQNMLFHNSA